MQLDIKDMQFDALPDELIRRAVTEAVAVAGIPLDRLSIALVDDDQMTDINRRFRGLDRPTDVISFEAETEASETAGEVIISTETARRQADERGHPWETELVWLIAHGVLHVAGMDDSTDTELEQMLVKQRIIMRRLNMNAPL